MRSLCLLTLILCTGCQSVLHEMKPHRLWRWNYYEPTSRDALGTFSIDDPLTNVSKSGQTQPPVASQETIAAPMPTVR